MKRKLVSLLLALSMVFSLLPIQAFAADKGKAVDTANPFEDVKQGSWYYDAVQYVRANGLFYGTSKTTFEPGGTMTRGMFVTVLGRMAGVDPDDYTGPSGFSDVPEDAYYAPYVAWAAKYGVTAGTGGGTFSPNANIDRQQMAAFFVRYFEAFDVDYKTGANITSVPADIDSVSPWARDAVLKLWREKLLSGDGGNFDPKGKATRAQAASVCCRTDETVATWYSEPGVPSKRVRIDPATGLPYSESNKPNGGSGSSGGGSSWGGSGSGGSGGTTVTTYYMVTFALGTNQTGMTLPNSGTYPANTQIGALPTPTAAEGGKVFLGWYYDAAMSSPAKDSDVLTRDVTLYAKIGAGAAVREMDTPNYIAAQDLSTDFQLKLKLDGTYSAGDLTIINVTANNANVTFNVENGVVKIAGIEGVDGEDTTRPEFSGRWNPGDTYKAVLTDGSSAVFIDQSGVEQAQTIRTYNFTIARAEAKNLQLDSGLKYIPKSDTTGTTDENFEGLFSVSLETETDTDGNPQTNIKKINQTGSFTYSGSEKLAEGDTVAIYDGQDPRTGSLTDSDRVAYVEITSVSGNTYNYKTADTEDVLFTPDVLPVNSNKKSAGDGNTLTLDGNELRTDLAAIGLDTNITVDKGDFIAFYSGDLESKTRDGGNKPEYGKITNVATNGDGTYTVTYADASESDVLTAMDIYTKENKEIKLTDSQIKEIESGIAQQAVKSGFLDAAARELTALALETDGFRKLAEDFDLESYAITFADGTPAGPEDLSLMAGAKAEITKKEISPNVHIGNLDHFEGSNGIRIELVMDLTIEVTGTKGKLIIELQAAFEQEVMLSVNASGGAIWKWKWIFPYIYDYRLNANIDVGTYTGIGITATAKTQGEDKAEFDWKPASGTTAEAKIIDIGKQITDLMKEKDKFMGKDLVGGDDGGDDDDDGGIPISGSLAEKYAAMIEDAGEDTSWIKIFEYEIFSKEGSVDPFHILCYGISADFVVKANFYVTLGMTFEYGAAKRYNFSIMLFHKESTNETIDLETPHYRFAFYVMGTMGIKAGVEFEIGVGLFSLKLDSIGICAEAGAYAQMWGYFYYEATWEQGQGKNSQYSGAMLIEIGAYLEISFKAQLFSSDKLTYQPTIYEHQWPILTVGEQENVFDFAEYDDSGTKIALEYPVQSAKTLALPSALFSMQYLDLQSGETGGGKDDDKPGRNCDDETESHFEIAMSDSHYTYDPATNTVTIDPEGKVSLPDCTMTIRWKNGTLAFTSQPIERVVTISWTDPVNARYIAFDSQGGSVVGQITGSVGDAVSQPTSPAKVGYDFGGWYTDRDCMTAFTFPDKLPEYFNGTSKGVTVYAKWDPREDTPYTVEHYQEELNGTYTRKEIETKTGTTDALVSVTAKNDPHFTVRDRELNAANASTKIAPDGSTVVKLYYTRNKYNVSFTYGTPAGMSEVPAAKTYTAKYEATVYAPMLALKGYEFSSFGPAVGEDKAVKVTGNATYNAQWTAKTDTPYRVEHYLQRVSGDSYALDSVENKTGTTGATVQADSLKKTDLTGFEYDHAGELSYTIANDGTTVVRLYYDRNSYSLTWNVGNTHAVTGGTPNGSVTYGAAITPPVSDQKGYMIQGWYETENCSGTPVSISTMPAYDLTLYAKWSELTGDVVVYINRDGKNTTEAPVDYTPGTALADPEARTGYTFLGWTGTGITGGPVASYTIPEGTTGPLTFTAHWEPISYTITYELNGGSGNNNPTTYTIEDAVTLADPTTPPNGMQFEGWYTDAAFTDKATEIPKGSTGSKTFYAKWEAATYLVTFELNGGAMTGSNPATYTIGTAHTLPTPTREHHRFEGWYDNASCDGSPLSATSSENTEDMTLHAKWTYIGVDMTYKLFGSGGDISTVTSSVLPAVLDLGEALPTDVPLTVDGCFVGWYSNKDKVTGNNVKVVPANAGSSYTVYLGYVPKTITTGEQMLLLETLEHFSPTQTYEIVLDADIDLTKIDGWSGDSDIRENVTVNGNGHTITTNKRIFCLMYGTLKDLNVTLASEIRFETKGTGLVAAFNYGTMENVHVGGGKIVFYCDDSEGAGTAFRSFGGIVAGSYGTIKDCTVGESATVPLELVLSGSGFGAWAGGIVGDLSRSDRAGETIEGLVTYTKNSSNYVVITCTGDRNNYYDCLGGVVGGRTCGSVRFGPGNHHIYVRLPVLTSYAAVGTIAGAGRGTFTPSDYTLEPITIESGATVTAHSNISVPYKEGALSSGYTHTEDGTPNASA